MDSRMRARHFGRFMAIVAVSTGLCSVVVAGYAQVDPAKRVNPGKVVVYTSQDEVYSEMILREFERQTGFQVRSVNDSEAVKTVGLANRLLAERHHPQCDLF